MYFSDDYPNARARKGRRSRNEDTRTSGLRRRPEHRCDAWRTVEALGSQQRYATVLRPLDAHLEYRLQVRRNGRSERTTEPSLHRFLVEDTVER